MSYSTHPFTTYLVGWDDQLIIKAGVTNRQRWRSFCLRGARLTLLHMASPEARDYCELEAKVHHQLGSTLDRAYYSRTEAVDQLGTKGCGYMECFRAPSPDAYRDALAACSRIMLGHGNGQCATDMPVLMHGRTHARTHERLLTAATILKVADAHAHTESEVVLPQESRVKP